MLSRLTPMLANEKTAATLLDMKPTDFRRLVEEGHLPKGKTIGGFTRWDTEDLLRIIRGDVVEGMGSVQW